MGNFRVSSPEIGSVVVMGVNWMAALGEGLGKLGVLDQIERVACEVLPNGTILVRDARRGLGYVVQPVTATAELEIIDDASSSESLGESTEERPFPMLDDEASVRNKLAAHASIIKAMPKKAEAMRQALDRLVSVVRAESAAVLLIDGNRLRFEMVHGPNALRLEGMSVPVETGFAGFALQRKTMLIVGNPQGDKRFNPTVDTVTGAQTRNLLVVPLVNGETPVGVLELVNAAAPSGFQEDDLVPAATLAEALAERLARPGP